MDKEDSSLSHHLLQVSVAQFIGKIPSHAKNNDLLINMAALEQSCRNITELIHQPCLSPQLSSCTRTDDLDIAVRVKFH
jgi:hypothetical protein